VWAFAGVVWCFDSRFVGSKGFVLGLANTEISGDVNIKLAPMNDPFLT